MAARQIDHLVKMANQIVLNMAPWGDEQAVAAKTAEHLEKFWTAAMREQLLNHCRHSADDLSPVVTLALTMIEPTAKTEEDAL